MQFPIRWISAGLVASAALASAISIAGTSCSQTPVNVPVRTFERAGRMDILCMQVLTTSVATDDSGIGIGTPINAIPVALDNCAPVATGVDPTTLPFHLLAVVTQTLRGELAVVDLTLGRVIDTSLALPGINFLPVGQNPTDVVVTPDATMVFVTAAETNKPAIYAIPATSLLGDSANLDEPTQAAEQVSLPSWPACALPQNPGRMVIVPTSTPAVDGGDAGAQQGFEIVVVMPGNGTDQPSLIGLIDTAPFSDGTIAPGSLSPCPIKSIIQLAENPAALPTQWSQGPSWPLGLPYVDGGIDLFATLNNANVTQTQTPLPSSDYAMPLWACPANAHAASSGPNVPDASPMKLPPGGQVHGTGVATDGRFVWVADDTMPFVHVVDTGTAGTLTELAPLLATSVAFPSLVVTTTELAVSPVTRDYKRYLYAVDSKEGSIIVYDVTDPANGPRSPLMRPNPELDPLQPPDRIAFGSPVATVTFARHDFPVPNQVGPAQTGLLCNPNPNAGDVGSALDPGVNYRANGTISVGLGPTRLRGVFAFATLTSGQVVSIDVDDWDAPCRRPIFLGPGNQTGSIAVPEPNPSSASDLDPYHAPIAQAASLGSNDAGPTVGADGGILNWVTDEPMWPAIQPNRIRSYYILADDVTGGGLHQPNLVAPPQLLVNGSPVAITGSNYAVLSAAYPEFPTVVTASPTTTPTIGSITPTVYMAHEVPDVHVDQPWNIVYEAALPNFAGIAVDVTASDFTSLTLTNAGAFFCGHGVEDQQLGLNRFYALQIDDATLQHNPNGVQSSIPILFDQRVGDYIQITDDILGAADAGPGVPLDDQYWKQPSTQDPYTCWQGITTSNGTLEGPAPGASDDDANALGLLRQQVCSDKFGIYGADQNPQRDFPILAAYDDHVVIGRYAYLDPVNRPTNGRLVVPADTSPQDDFKLAKCCFHSQMHFNVRASAEWVALGANNLFLHHVVADSSGRCVQSCEPRFSLLSSRLPELAMDGPASTFPEPSRNSPFALRNPAFSFFMPAPVVTGADAANFYSVSVRDDAWQFTTRGQYTPQTVALTGSTTAVLPQSSMFVAPLGAIAIVDGSAEGLFIIDLNTLSIADGSPFF